MSLDMAYFPLSATIGELLESGLYIVIPKFRAQINKGNNISVRACLLSTNGSSKLPRVNSVVN